MPMGHNGGSGKSMGGRNLELTFKTEQEEGLTCQHMKTCNIFRSHM